MKIKTKEVRDGKHNGKTVWICHYHRPDMNKKPLRCVPPTRVVIRSNDELPRNKTVYYSESHFRPLNKKDKPLAKVISPVDNTCYRSLCGNELYVFDNEVDCVSSWRSQVDEYLNELDELIENAARKWITEKDNLKAIY